MYVPPPLAVIYKGIKPAKASGTLGARASTAFTFSNIGSYASKNGLRSLRENQHFGTQIQALKQLGVCKTG